MTKSWDSYYVVFLSGILSLGIPLSLSLISSLFFPKKIPDHSPASRESMLSHRSPRANQAINVRFFLAANAALVLISIALELVPCVATIQSGGKESLLKGLIAVVSLASFSALGLVYATRKGNMNWLPSAHIKEPSQDQDSPLTNEPMKEIGKEMARE